MNMRACVVVLVAIALQWNGVAETTNRLVRAEKVSRIMRLYGGKIAIPDSQKGTIAIFNAQKIVRSDEFMPIIDSFTKTYRYKIIVKDVQGKITPQTAKNIMSDNDVQAAVFLTGDGEITQRLLVAPEERWTLVNVKSVIDGAKNKVFEIARVRKELLRGLLCAAGAMNSEYPGNMMYPISSVSELDTLVDSPPIDAIIRTVEALKKIGVTAEERVTYEDACREGWAPQPTNDFQKAVWERVHEAPSNPLKITYDKDRQKPVVK